MQEPQNRGQHHARRVTPGKISCLSQRRGGEQRTEGHRVLQGRRGGEQGPPCPRLALGAGETSSGWRLAVHGAGSKEQAGWAPAEGPRSPGRRPWAPVLRQPPLQHRHRLRPWPGCSRTTSLGALRVGAGCPGWGLKDNILQPAALRRTRQPPHGRRGVTSGLEGGSTSERRRDPGDGAGCGLCWAGARLSRRLARLGGPSGVLTRGAQA